MNKPDVNMYNNVINILIGLGITLIPGKAGVRKGKLFGVVED